jgi:drug/metabolite transporter (DMT)-like permease
MTQPGVRSRSTWWVHVAMTVTVASWGLVFVGVARMLREIDVVQIVVIRFGLMALCFIAISLSRKSMRPRFKGREWGWLLAAGVLCVPLSQLPIVNAQRFLSPALASTIGNTGPAWTALLAVIILGERFRRLQVGGFLLALTGASVVIIAGSGDGEFVVRNPWMAALSVISPLSWAGFTIISKRFSGTAHPLATLAVATTMGMLVMAPLFPHAAHGIAKVSPTGWAWLAFLVLGGTVMPYITWMYALKVLPASTTVSYLYGIPIAALVWAWIILDAVPNPLAILGGVLTIAGVFAIQRPAPNARTSAPQQS